MIKKQLPLVDLFKLIGSLLIFAMHCKAFGDYSRAQTGLEVAARFAVPFFFISSSYFLFQKADAGNISSKTLLAYLRRIGMLYLVWLIYNVPSVYFTRLAGKDLSQLKTWVIIFKNSLLSSTFTGSWYLASSIFSACLIYLLSKRWKTSKVLILTLFLYLPCVFTSLYNGLLPSRAAAVLHELCFPLNLVNGCFYFAIGKALVENEDRLKSLIPKKRALLMAALAFLLFVFEVVLARKTKIQRNTDCGFFLPLLAVSLFLFCLQGSSPISNGALLRKISTIVFCCQGNILYYKTPLCAALGINSSMLAFLVALLCAVLISGIVLFLQRKSRFRWASFLT